MKRSSEFPSDDLSAYITDLQRKAHEANVELVKWRIVALASLAFVGLYALRTVSLVLFGV